MLDRFKQVLREEKGKLTGTAVSQARRIKSLQEINPKKFAEHADARSAGAERARPTDVIVTDKRGRQMQYWSDGSLRHMKQGGK